MRVNGKIVLKNRQVYGLVVDGMLYQNANYEGKATCEPPNPEMITTFK